jgi:beta-lactamase superfamily II metal-dependent hydrolase
MILSLDVRRARKGDCLILHYGTKEDPGVVLIDGGPSQVYTPQLKPRLAQIRNARGLAADDPLPVNLMMVSHIDDDHINGILELTKELVTATDQKQPLPLKIRNLWHNSFDDIIGNSPKELLASVTASFGAAGLLGELDSEEFDAHTAHVLASVGQGFHLRDDARKLKLPVNKQFGGGLVMADKKDPIDFGKGLQFTVAGPMKAELIALQKEHDAFLKTEESKKNKAALASFTDNSVANLSSLVLLAEVDKKRILLTGDARGDKILEGLELVQLLTPGGDMHIDILKVPHHGSDRNMETVFFKRVTADHYVFSGNGEHGNPERETLKMLLEARGNANYTVHLTYPVDEIDKGRKADWEKEQAKEKVKKQSKPNTKVRENWSPDKHSLTAFLNANKEFAKKIKVVEKDKPHVIDLHEALGF